MATDAAIATAENQNEPVTKMPLGAVAEAVVAEHGGERVAVGDRLAPRRQVGPDADRLPAAAVGEAEPAAHVVEDQRGAGVVADAIGGRWANAGSTSSWSWRASCLNGETTMAATSSSAPAHGLLHRLEVVVAVVQQVGPVLGHDAGDRGRAPRRRAVVGALGHEHLAASGRRPGDRHARRRGVGAVLGEHAPSRRGRRRRRAARPAPPSPRPGRSGSRPCACWAAAAASTAGWRWPSTIGP